MATLELAKALIARRSITTEDAGCLELVAARLAPLGFTCERIDSTGPTGLVRNLWARRGTAQPLVVFAGHTDVVPPGPLDQWQSDPFVPTERDGMLYGRGAADMKTSVAAAVVAVFTTWKQGRESIAALQQDGALPIEQIVREAEGGLIARIPGTAVFLCGMPGTTPSALLHNLKHNRVLHRQNLFVSVRTEDVPRVPEEERFEHRPIGPDFHQVLVRYGFTEDPDIPEVLSRMAAGGFPFAGSLSRLTYILSDNTLVTTQRGRMNPWRLALFAFLYRNALRPTQFFRLPINQVIEIGRQIQL